MTNPQYVFDSNVFMNMQRRYPSEVFVSLWSHIEALIENQIVISSDEVLGEIQAGTDSLKDWANARESAFFISDEPVQKLVRTILTTHSALVTGARNASGADPFVIALAKIKNCTVVTDETRNGDKNQPPKIPNVCDAYGVRYIRFVGFLRERKITI